MYVRGRKWCSIRTHNRCLTQPRETTEIKSVSVEGKRVQAERTSQTLRGEGLFRFKELEEV